MTRSRPVEFADMLSAYCTKRLSEHLEAADVERIRIYLLTLLDQRQMPPSRLGGLDWQRIADAIGVDVAIVRSMRSEIRPALDALARELMKAGGPAEPGKRPPVRQTTAKVNFGPAPYFPQCEMLTPQWTPPAA